jgi:hypothetical protein
MVFRESLATTYYAIRFMQVPTPVRVHTPLHDAGFKAHDTCIGSTCRGAGEDRRSWHVKRRVKRYLEYFGAIRLFKVRLEPRLMPAFGVSRFDEWVGKSVY